MIPWVGPKVLFEAAKRREEDEVRKTANPFPELECFSPRQHRAHTWSSSALKDAGPYWCNGRGRES